MVEPDLDTGAKLRADLNKSLNEFRNAGSATVDAMVSNSSRLVSGVVSESIDGMESIGDAAEEALGEAASAVSDIMATAMSSAFGPNWDSSLQAGANTLKDVFRRVGLPSDKITSDFLDVLEQMGGVAKDNSVNIGLAIAGPKLESLIGGAFAPLKAMESRVIAINGEAAQMFATFGEGFGVVGGQVSSMTSLVNSFNTDIRSAALATNMSTDDMRKGYLELGKGGVDVKEILGSGMTFKADSKEINFLAQSMNIAKGTGIDMADVGGKISYAMRELGMSGQEPIKMFGMLKRAQEGTHLGFGVSTKAVLDGADALKMYGNNVDSTAAIYQNFVHTLGKGREGLAGGLVKKVASGLAGMSTGFRAFLGMTGQVGGGSGGAIGGALRVEEALVTGNTQGVLDDLSRTIERLTGTGILTRREAIDTNQEKQYFMQREVVSSALNLKGEDATRVQEMLGSDQKITADDIRRGAGSGLAAINKDASDVYSMNIGSVQALQNQARVLTEESLSGMTDGMRDLNVVVKDFTNTYGHDLIGFFKNALQEMGSTSPASLLPKGEREMTKEDMNRANTELNRVAGGAGIGGSASQMMDAGLPLSGLSASVAQMFNSGLAISLEEAGMAGRGALINDLNRPFVEAGDAAGDAAGGRFSAILSAFSNDELPVPIAAAKRIDVDAATNLVSKDSGVGKAPIGFTMADNQPLMLKIAVDSDGTMLNLKPFLEEAGQRAAEAARSITMSEGDGAFASPE